MLVETEAIVLRTIKFSETSVIAHLYTEAFGCGAYLMNGVRTNRSKMAFFQPLSVVRIHAYRSKTGNSVHRIKDIAFSAVPVSLPSNVFKSTIAMFVAEIADRVFNDEDAYPQFFRFFRAFVLQLESSDDFANLHILFMVHLLKYLGFLPKNNFGDRGNAYFSLTQAEFVPCQSSDEVLAADESRLLARALAAQPLVLTRHERQTLLRVLVAYYDAHVCTMQNLQSLEVLQTVFE